MAYTFVPSKYWATSTKAIPISNGASINTASTVNSNGWVTVFHPNFEEEPVTDVSGFPALVKQAKVTVGVEEGYECSGCKGFYPMAELNMPENAKEFISFKCYQCRKEI